MLYRFWINRSTCL